MIAKLFDGILKIRLVGIALILVLTSLFVYNCTSFVLLDDPNRWPPETDSNVTLNDLMQENFGGANLVTIQLTVKEGDIFNPITLRKIKRITYNLSQVWGTIPYNLYSLAAIRVRYLRSSQELMENVPLMETVPTDPEGLKRIKWGVDHNPTIYGTLVSPDYKSTLIVADFRTTKVKGSLTELPLTEPIKIYKEVTRIIAPENDENHIVRCVGTPIIIGWVNSEGLPYVLTAFGIFVLGVIIVLSIGLRRKRAVTLSLILALMSIAWGFGLNNIFFGNILRSSSAFIAPFFIMATVTCHAVQFFRRYLHEEHVTGMEPSSALKNTVVALSKPLIISLITDGTAFLVLAVVPFDNISVMGRITFLGFVGTIVCLYLFLIPMISLFPPDPKDKKELEERKASWFERAIDKGVRRLIMPGKFRWVVFAFVSLLLIVSIVLIPGIRCGQDNTYAIHNYLTKSYKNNSIYLMEMEFKKKFKGVYPLSILIETKEKGGLLQPEVLRKMEAFSSFLTEMPEVAGTSHFAQLIKLLNQYYMGRDDAYVIPDSKRLVGFYYNELSSSEPGATEGVVDFALQQCPFYVYVGDTRQETVEKVYTAAANYARDHFNDDAVIAKVGGGSIGIAKAFNKNIAYWLIMSSLFSALASFIVVFFLIRSALGGLLLLLPLFVGTIIWLAVVYILGIEINSNTTAGMAISMGVGIDAEIYFLYRFREEYARLKDFREALVQGFTKIRMALIYSHSALIIGLWFLVPIPLYIGYVAFTMGLIVLLCFVVSFTLSPILWSVLKPAFLFEKKEDRQ